jgi:hypothetical protein
MVRQTGHHRIYPPSQLYLDNDMLVTLVPSPPSQDDYGSAVAGTGDEVII